MPEFIPRDASTPFDPQDPIQMAEFEGFACDVPTDDKLIEAVHHPSSTTNANSVRAARMFVPALVAPDRLEPILNDDTGEPEFDDETGLPEVNFPTPDRLEPSAGGSFARQGLHDLEISVPGLEVPVPMWSFRARINNDNPVDVRSWPGSTIRVREGQVVHSYLKTRTGPHTIHHHGIEPTAMNDGVGHLTFEIGGGYTYQWLAGEAGTYFYHCHRNTTLHFEMGMYGMLIVDPNVPGAPFTDGGPGAAWVANDLVSYEAEAIWVADDIDTRWHGLGDPDKANEPQNGFPLVTHVAMGIQDCDSDGRSGFIRLNDDHNPRLHEFRPNVFVVSGVAGQFGADNAVIATAPGTVVTPRVIRQPGKVQRLLVRALNASYCTQTWKFPSALQGRVIAADGRTLGRSPFGRYSSPYTLASIGHRFELTTARRHDILLDIADSTPAGNYEAEITFRHWITDLPIRTVKTRIVVE